MLVIKLDSRGGMNWFFFMNHILYSLQSQTKALSHQDVHRWKKEAPVPEILLYLPFIPLTRSSHISSLPLPGKGSTKISEKDTCRMNTGTDFLVCWTVSLSWDLLPWQGWDALMFAMTETTTSPLWVMTGVVLANTLTPSWHPWVGAWGSCQPWRVAGSCCDPWHCLWGQQDPCRLCFHDLIYKVTDLILPTLTPEDVLLFLIVFLALLQSVSNSER